MAHPTEVGLLPLAHQLKVQRLPAEVALGGRVGLQLQAHLLPGLHQLFNKIVHHLWGVVRRGGNAEKLIPPGYSRVVDGLDVDVVLAHHDVTHQRVLRCV